MGAALRDKLLLMFSSLGHGPKPPCAGSLVVLFSLVRPTRLPQFSFFPLLTLSCARLKILELSCGVLWLAVCAIVAPFFFSCFAATSGRFAMFHVH